ncbi:gfo/Idh/MocA family oxidoreductase [Salibacterium salarium]|uniref:Gfo/Idh/MocA family oxidoreductase n=1 Tax=Salibacterium salarium TaxID=284579 RepID=A0A3R9P5Z9_9BACI|nr:Gfo/Idh/MocA family oxidoreductase [Salibacterium salarium]RSL33543.1 gfo/Idh/MocA family oxidoreductase [Salibacterium salarium]
MEETLQWGIIGGARIAQGEFLPALHKSEQGEIRAVASKSGSSDEYQDIPVFYPSYEELLDDRLIDAVYIALPNSLHAEWAKKAMEKGKHVLLEKPAGISLQEVTDMKKAAEKNQVVLMEAFMHQFHKQHDVIKKLLQKNKLGEWQYFKAHFSFQITNLDDIRLKKELGGGALYDIGCYGIHTMNQLLEWKPEKVTTRGKRNETNGVDVLSTSIFEDENGRFAEILASFDLPPMNQYEIICEKGSILLEHAYRPDASANGCGTITVKDQNGTVVSTTDVQDDAYLNEINHIQACIRENTSPLYTLGDSEEVNLLVERAYQSLREQKTKDIKF